MTSSCSFYHTHLPRLRATSMSMHEIEEYVQSRQPGRRFTTCEKEKTFRVSPQILMYRYAGRWKMQNAVVGCLVVGVVVWLRVVCTVRVWEPVEAVEAVT